MVRSGFLACHMIGNDGNPGPGPNLTRVGSKLTPAAITRALRNPAAPMPSYSGLDSLSLRSLVSYLTRLRANP